MLGAGDAPVQALSSLSQYTIACSHGMEAVVDPVALVQEAQEQELQLQRESEKEPGKEDVVAVGPRPLSIPL